MITFNNDWDDLLINEFQKSYYQQLRKLLINEYKTQTIYPQKENIFSAFKLTPYKDIKIVILGQDPYHGKGQAHGLAFSVEKGIPNPPSLQNIFKELQNEGEGTCFKHGSLENWAKQGIFLLNTTLTVREGCPNSHVKLGWNIFTDEVIKLINQKKEPVIFLLWGNNARNKKQFITNSHHIVLETVHPSPLSANRGFFGCNHFKKVNEILEKFGKDKIKWDLY